MLKSLPTLTDMLSQRTHRDLELIARAHDLPFTRRESKALGLAKLIKALENGVFQKGLNSLTSNEIVPLQALQVAGGWLPAYLFQHHPPHPNRLRCAFNFGGKLC